jgi:hypothetical protein
VARVMCVHGVGQQLKGEDSPAGEWAQALRDGMRRVDCAETRLPGVGEIRCVFYGDVFRPAGRRLAVGDPWLTAADATEFDLELLAAWWRGAAECDPQVRSRTDRSVLCGWPRFAAMSQVAGMSFMAWVLAGCGVRIGLPVLAAGSLRGLYALSFV